MLRTLWDWYVEVYNPLRQVATVVSGIVWLGLTIFALTASLDPTMPHSVIVDSRWIASVWAIIFLIALYFSRFNRRDSVEVASLGVIFPLIIPISIIFMLSIIILAISRIFINLFDRIVFLAFRRKDEKGSDKYGELWRGPGVPETIVMVKVKDKIGTHWIRVSPRTQSARDGIARSYGMAADSYEPQKRT